MSVLQICLSYRGDPYMGGTPLSSLWQIRATESDMVFRFLSILGVGVTEVSTRVHKQELHFTSHETNNTFSRFSKIEVVPNVKNIMLVPLFLYNRVLPLYFSKFTRVLWTLWKTPFGYKFAREASCRWVWAYLRVELHQKIWKWSWIKPPDAS